MPIWVMPSGIEIDFSALPSNAHGSIAVTLSGMVNSETPVNATNRPGITPL